MKNKRSPKHFSCRKGTTVAITFHDGVVVIDTFIEKKSSSIFLKKTGRIRRGDIKSFRIYKPHKYRPV